MVLKAAMMRRRVSSIEKMNRIKMEQVLRAQAQRSDTLYQAAAGSGDLYSKKLYAGGHKRLFTARFWPFCLPLYRFLHTA